MFWLWSRLPSILSLAACLLYVGGLTPSGRLYVRGLPPAPPSVPSPAVVPQPAQPEAKLQVSVRTCALGRATEAGVVTVRLYHQQGEHYAEVPSEQGDAAQPFEFSVEVGGYWLVSSAQGCARDVQWLAIFEQVSQQVQVQLGRADTVRVVVRDEDGVPLLRAWVLVADDSAITHGQFTNARGLVEFAELDGAVDRIVVRAEGFEPLEATPTRDGATVVTLKRLGSISVEVAGGDGQPVAGAVVRLAGGPLPEPLEVVTDDQGVARIVGLERGSYDLRAESESQVSPSRLGFVLGSGQARTLKLVLAPGQFVSLSVVDGSLAHRPPVADARVVVVEQGLGPFPRHGWTDAQGRVRLGPLPAGESFLSVSADGYVSVDRVAVAGESRQRVELLASGVLEGQIVDAEGRGISGARLELVGNDVFGRPVALRSGTRGVRRAFFAETALSSSSLAPVGQLGVTAGAVPHFSSRPLQRPDADSWQSDEEGKFALRDVPPGRLRVLVNHPDFASTLSEAISLASGDSAFVLVTVLGGAVVEGTVVDAQGQLQLGARVDLIARHGADVQTTFSDENGHFAFSDVPAAIELRVARPEDSSQFVLKSRHSVSPQSVLTLALELPKVRGIAEFVVLDPEGYPVDDARVSLVSLQPDVPFRRSVYVDAQGVAFIEDAMGLHAELTVNSPRFRTAITRFAEVPSQQEVRLLPAYELRGEVTQVRGRRALEGAEVEWKSGRQLLRTTTDALGAFRFEGVSPGPGWLTISKVGFARHTGRVVIESGVSAAEGGQALEPIDLLPGGGVEGLVVDGAGRAVANARVGQGLIPAFLPIGSHLAGYVQTDAVGRFFLEQLPAGTVQLSAYAVEVGRGSVEGVEILEGDVTRDVVISLRGHHPDTEPGTLANVAITLGERQSSGRTEVVVVHVAHPSEASRAGLVVGDVVLRVDGNPAGDLEQTRSQLGGPEGSDLVVVVRREGAEVAMAMRRQAVRR